MNKKIVITFFFSLPLLAAAENKALFPKSGISIVPLSQMDFPPQAKSQMLKDSRDQKTKGYIEVDNNNAYDLLQIKTLAPSEIQAFKSSTNLYDSHLKKKQSDIKLGFDFHFSPLVDPKNIIGYAPAGGYIADEENKKFYSHGGWSGIILFFTEPSIGICSYQLLNLKISHGSIQMSKEYTKYIVNNKPSTAYASGKPNVGFIYGVVWDDPQYDHQINCATYNFDKTLLPKVIELANKLDKGIIVRDNEMTDHPKDF